MHVYPTKWEDCNKLINEKAIAPFIQSEGVYLGLYQVHVDVPSYLFVSLIWCRSCDKIQFYPCFMVSTNTDVVLLHPGKFNMLNPKNGGLDQMMFLFNWIIFLCSILIFRSVSGLLSLFFLMSKMKLTIFNCLSCIDPTPRRNKHSWLEVMTSTREPINTALDFCHMLKPLETGMFRTSVGQCVCIYLYIYIFSRHRVVWALWAYFFGNEKMDNIRSRHWWDTKIPL